MKKHDLLICFRTFATLAAIGVFLILTNDFAHSSLSSSSTQVNSSSDVGNILYVSGAEEQIKIFTYKGDPTTQFIENDDATKEYPIVINRDIVDLANGQELRIVFPEQVYATIILEKTLRHPGNSLTIVGFLKEFGQLFRVIITFHNDAIRGRITTPDGVLKLISTPDGDFLIDQRDSHRIPGLLNDDMLLPPESESIIINSPPIKMASLGNTTIDLMIVYTSGFANNYPGTQLIARINELIAIANTAYADSGVNITLNLVYTTLVTYPDTVSNTTALQDITDGVAGFSGIAALRSQSGADLVSLIRPYNSSNSGSCGVAWLNGFQGYDISLYADSGYSVTLDGEYSVGITTYFCTDLSLVHELGHNMGSAHDRANSTEGSPGIPFDGVYSYSYGYGIDGVFGSIMSYTSPGVAIFSNPDLTSCNGQVCGVDESLSNSANNALSLNNSREAIAGYEASSTCPDSDADGICDASDICPADPNNDADGDGVCGDVDICLAGDDGVDTDSDGIPDACDTCPNDADNDADQDGVCGDVDICLAGDDNVDTDSDGTPDACDTCPKDADNDADSDGICGDVDPCPADFYNDADQDGICGDLDVCPGGDDNIDTDSDSIPDYCDECPDDADNDADGDGVCGDQDICAAGDDTIDTDFDAVPDACDNCPLDANTTQDDNDSDNLGDICDPDDDNDGINDEDDVFPNTPDTQVPVIISGPTVTAITANSAVISWQTNEMTSGGVTYGLTSPPGTTSNDPDPVATLHSVTLNGLSADTNYYVSTFASDLASNDAIVSPVLAFRTKTVSDTVAPVIISGPVVTSVDHQSAVVEWTTNEPSKGHVSFGETDQLGQILTDSALATTHQVTISGLSAQTLYYVNVDATDDFGNGSTSSGIQEFTTTSEPDTLAPQIIDGPMVVGVTSSGAVVYWTTDEPSTSQVLYNDGTDNAAATDNALVTEHLVYLEWLNASTLYSLTVSSRDALSNGPTVSSEIQFTTLGTPDNDPPVLIDGPVVNMTHQSAVIRWRTDEPASGVIEYGLASDQLLEVESHVSLTQPHNMTLTGLEPETAYYFQLVSTDSEGNEAVDGPYQFTTTGDDSDKAPEIINSPEVIYLSDDTLTVVWTTDEPTDTVVEYNESGQPPMRRSNAAKVTKHQVTLKGLKPNTEYQIKVIATDVDGNTTVAQFGNRRIFVATLDSFVPQTAVLTESSADLAAPVIASGPVIVNLSDTHSIIYWQTDEISDSLVHYGLSGGTLTHQAGIALDVDEHTIVLTNLTPDTQYDYTVESIDPSDNGPTVSSTYSFTTLATPDVTAPVITSDPVATTVKTASATIEWATDEASSANVNYGTASGSFNQTRSVAENALNHTVTLTDLIAGTTFYYEVISADLSGNSVTSSEASFITTGTAPIDTDGDGIFDAEDNCPTIVNADQADSDSDGTGDACTVVVDGDVAPYGNRDGVVNVGDALVCLRFALGLEAPSSVDRLRADVAPLDANGQPNPNGVINVGDALVILRKAVGLIDF